MQEPIYLDYNATTPLHPAVLEEMLPFLQRDFGNASSSHLLGRKAFLAIEEAREKVAACIGAQPSEIIFTTGATQAIDWVITFHSKIASDPTSILCSATEHDAVWKAIAKNGNPFSTLSVNPSGLLDGESLVQALAAKPTLICTMLANNETGVISDIKAIAEKARNVGCEILCDATQALGKIPVDVKKIGANFVPFSSHKIYGPKGAGALYVDSSSQTNLQMTQWREQEKNSGTPNTAAIVGFGKACELIKSKTENNWNEVAALRDLLEEKLLAYVGVSINGKDAQRLPNTSSITFSNHSAQLLLDATRSTICVSTGSACNSANHKPSRTLAAMGLSPTQISSTIRISLGRETTQEEILQATEALFHACRLV